MSKKDFQNLNCSIAQALDQIGEHWTLMILRNAFHGIRHFEDFQKQLDISPTILSIRLKKLTNNGIFSKQKNKDDGRSIEYRLTEKGMEIYPVMIALLNWGEKYTPSPTGERIRLVDRQNGLPLPPVQVISSDGRALKPQDVTVLPGMGTDDQLMDLITYRKKRKN